MVNTKNTVSDIFYSRAKTELNSPCLSVKEALNFGFSYIESQDHVVEFIVANPLIMKGIFKDVPDAKVIIDDTAIGELWTAKLFLSDKLKNNQILFSNSNFSAVINLNLNQGEFYGPV